MNRDRELLARFARHRSEEAFAQLVRRHLDLVYGTALRHLRGNVSRTTEVTQAVFAALAARASELAAHPHPADWLYRTARACAAEAVRTELLRPDPTPRSHSAHPLPLGSAGEETTGLTGAALHDALAALDPASRELLLLRFPGGHAPGTVAALLELREETVREALARALDALRDRLGRRGVTLPATTLHTILANQAIAAPPDLAASVIAGALTGAAAFSAAPAHPANRSTGRFLRRALPWLATTVAVVALTLRNDPAPAPRAPARDDEAAQLRQETTRLAAALAASEQREADATVKIRELSAKLVEIVSQPPPAPPPPRAETYRAAPAAKGQDPRATREALAARLAEFKPLLEAGRPIRGAAVVLVEGRPVPRPVEFVLGRDTRIEGGDDGTYVVRPALNLDGSVKYQITLVRRDPATGTDRSETFPAITQTPWDPFTVGGPGGRAFAFDPEEPVP
jgi:RNA polymerase sigma factor (sigma-70 family)